MTGVESPCGTAAGGDSTFGPYVWITGYNLGAGDSVSFGSAAVSTGVTYKSEGTPPAGQLQLGALKVVAPASPLGGGGIGTVDITVTNGNGTSSVTQADRYTYTSGNESFGICGVSAVFTDPIAGGPFAQAGGHPNLTISLGFNDAPDIGISGFGAFDGPAAVTKDIAVTLPRGVLGDPSAIPSADLCTQTELRMGACPATSVVGYAAVTTDPASSQSLQPGPVYLVDPAPGEAAELAMFPLNPNGALSAALNNVSIPLTVGLKKATNGDYVLVTNIRDLPQAAPVVGTTLTLLANPGSSTHAFMDFAPDCGQSSLTTTVSADSWNAPGTWATSTATSPGPTTGCGTLPFNPSVTVTPTTTQADSAAGYTVDLSFPQNQSATQMNAPLQNASVMLPAGVSINPALADGVQACTSAQFDISSSSPAQCPAASTIGTVAATSPLTPGVTLTGGIYVAQDPATPTVPASPFHIDMELAANNGVDVKLQGTITPDPSTGQLTTTFLNNPPVLLSDLKLTFNSGARAPLANPLSCGPATTTATLTPWSGVNGNGGPSGSADAALTSAFTVDADGSGGACPASWPSTPTVSVGPTNPVAGGLTNFTFTATVPPRSAPLTTLSIATPPGFAGYIANVPLCPEPQASAGSCPASSAVGTTTIGLGVPDSSGAGSPSSDEYYLNGTVYLTGPYGGGPFGMAIVVDPIAGPFNLESPFGSPVVVRAAISVDPNDGHLTITSTLPTIQDGIPLRLRTVNVTINRPGFLFNPTNCSPTDLHTTSVLSGATVTSPFQVAGCQALPFNPTITATAQGATSNASGASLDVKVNMPPGDTNLKAVTVTFPKNIVSRFSTVQQACPEATFDAGPTRCPAASLIGTGTATTPILSTPLAGTVYLVSHGAKSLPTLNIVLQGQGVTVDVSGTVGFTSTMQTTSTVGAPDLPISSFDLNLPEGPHSALTNTDKAQNLCGMSLSLPTTLEAHDGAKIVQNTPLKVTGCKGGSAKAAGAVKSASVKVRGHKLVLSVNLRKGGVLTVSGREIKRYRHRLKKGRHRITLHLNSRGLRAQRQHKRIALTLKIDGTRKVVHVRLGGKASHTGRKVHHARRSVDPSAFVGRVGHRR